MEVKKEPFSFRKVQKSDRENIDRDSSQPTVFELGTSVGIYIKKKSREIFQISYTLSLILTLMVCCRSK